MSEINSSLRPLRQILSGIWLGLLFLSPTHADSGTSGPDKVTIFTHGDSRFAQLQKNGSINGSASDALACAMPRLGIPYEFSILPLSRANSVVDTYENAMWFPAAHSGNPDRMNRMVGPIDDLAILWYQMARNTQDPNSDAFRQSARVTAYTGSALETELQNGGYTMLPGSADHNRLIYMLMSGGVDGLLAIDFRDVLSPETRQLVEKRLRVTLQRTVPISFQASIALTKKSPGFITELRKTVRNCVSSD